MNLQEAKKVKVGDKVIVKGTEQMLTVANKTFVMAGIGYPTNAIQFEFEETDDRHFHQFLKKVT